MYRQRSSALATRDPGRLKTPRPLGRGVVDVHAIHIVELWCPGRKQSQYIIDGYDSIAIKMDDPDRAMGRRAVPSLPLRRRGRGILNPVSGRPGHHHYAPSNALWPGAGLAPPDRPGQITRIPLIRRYLTGW